MNFKCLNCGNEMMREYRKNYLYCGDKKDKTSCKYIVHKRKATILRKSKSVISMGHGNNGILEDKPVRIGKPRMVRNHQGDPACGSGMF